MSKMPKTFFFFKKIAKDCEKMTIFDNFFGKKCQVFGNFLTFKWQFSGGQLQRFFK